MKKNNVFFLAMGAAWAFSLMASAEGKLTADLKSVYVYDGKDSGQFYAKVTNTGDAPAVLDEANLVLFSDTDEILMTKEYINSFPSDMIIQPGEYVYLSAFLWDSALENAAIGDVKFSVQAGDKGNEVAKIPCEASFEINGSNSYDNYVYVTVTNDSSETVYNYYVTSALTDAEGNVCFVDNQSLEVLGVGPDSTITLKMYIDNDMIKYYELHQIIPTTADAMVFCKK